MIWRGWFHVWAFAKRGAGLVAGLVLMVRCSRASQCHISEEATMTKVPASARLGSSPADYQRFGIDSDHIEPFEDWGLPRGADPPGQRVGDVPAAGCP